MSDEKLRDLERRWRETGTVEDEAALLAEQTRHGRLLSERLRLAAFLQQTAASEALRGSWAHWTGFADVLLPCGPEACVRTGVALARAALPVWTQRFAHTGLLVEDQDRRPAAALDALEAWVLEPSSAAASAVQQAVVALSHSLHVSAGSLPSQEHGRDEVQAALCVLTCLTYAGRFVLAELHGFPPPDARVVDEMLENGAQALGLRLGGNPLRGPETTIGAGLPRALEILARDLVPWALGRGDPLRVATS